MIIADMTRPKFKNLLFNPDHKWLVDQPGAVYLTLPSSPQTKFEYVI
jgi:hypothetical protein